MAATEFTSPGPRQERGKTTFMLESLRRSLLRGEDFLGFLWDAATSEPCTWTWSSQTRSCIKQLPMHEWGNASGLDSFTLPDGLRLTPLIPEQSLPDDREGLRKDTTSYV